MKKRICLILFPLLLCIVCVLCSCAVAEDEPLFIAQEGWKQGFINAEGEWVIEPIYTKVWPFTSAGYAAVETEEKPLISSFKLIDRQGNIVADLPEWRLDYNVIDSYYGRISRQNAVGQAFVLTSVNDMYQSALYLADTGELIELDQSFLEYNLSPGAEINVTYQYDTTNKLRPYMFYLLDWDDRMVLAFKYEDYHKGLRGSAEMRVIEDDYCAGFVILDRNGGKVHDGCFNGLPDVFDLDHENREYRITSSFLLTGNNRIFEDHSLRNLIDRNGEIILEGLPEHAWWDEAAQAAYLADEENAILTNGERISREEYIKRSAHGKPCGITLFLGKYYNTRGEPVSWDKQPDEEPVSESEFGNQGLAWISFSSLWEDSCLIDSEGKIIGRNIIPAFISAQPVPPDFTDGWECVCPLEESGVGYINTNGELMYHDYPFNYAEPFKDGLAHVQIMDEQYNLLNAYINSSGRVVWAEQGRKDEIQQWLDQHEHHTVSDMTVDDARRMLVGEWDCTGGGEFLGYPILFYEDGTCNIGADCLLKWNILENTSGNQFFWDAPSFVLIFGDEEGWESAEDGLGLSFSSVDSFCVTDFEGGSGYTRMPLGYWERNGYNLEADEDGNLEVGWRREIILPKEPPEFGLTDSKFTGKYADRTGVLAFRKSPYRQNAVVGSFGSIAEPEMIWQADIGPAVTAEERNWQPLIVKWAKEVRNSITILSDEKRRTSALKEVIAVGTDHAVHFYDLVDGKETRPVIDGTEAGLHGTGSLPVAFPVLFVSAKKGFACYDLRDNSRKTELDDILSTYSPGKNVLYQDEWLLMDSGGYTHLAHLAIDLYLENGMQSDDRINIDITDSYLTDYKYSWGNDVPASADGSIVYTVSDSSLVRRNTMTDQKANWPEDEFWAAGQILSAVAVDHPQDREGALYIGSSELGSHGICKVYRVNAETLESVWEISFRLDHKLLFPGGVLSSPVIGQEGLTELVYFTVTGLFGDEGESALIAIYKDTGKMLWSLPMQVRTVSSPVAVYTEKGKGYLIQVDGNGVMHVADGLTGELLYSYELGGTVTTSPAVYRNMLVIRCQKDDREMLCGVRIGE